MKYIKELYIGRFRGIKDLELRDLGEINILVGENNAGKTSILEAISIIENPSEVGHIIKIGKKREILNNQSSPYTIFANMLNKSSKSIEIKGIIEDEEFELSIKGKKISIVTEESYAPMVEGFEWEVKVTLGKLTEIKDLKIFENENNFVIDNELNKISISHLTPIDHLLENSANEVIKRGKKKELVQLLTIFDKNIIGLEMVEENRKTVPYVEHKKLGLMPLSTYGDGLKKVLLLGSAIIKAKNGVLLIDEVETAIHTDVLDDVFRWFVKACQKYHTQVFMTTHSIEVIDAILESQDNDNNQNVLQDSLRVITLKNNMEEKKTKVRNLNGLEALEAREDFGLELR